VKFQMMPVTQTLFSLNLFFALTSLLAWTGRRDRARRLAPGVPDR
jgi:hypothetical protein